MKVSRGKASVSSDISVNEDLDFLTTFKVLRLSAPASGGALRKGNKDIANAEIADAAAIAATKIANTAMTRTLIPTRGDMIYRGASVPQKLVKGTSGHYLKQGANDPAWAALAILTEYLLYPYLSEEAGATGGIADASTNYAHSVKPTENLLITKIGVFVASKTSNGCNVIVEVWTDSGGDPDAVIGGATATIAAGSVVADSINWFILGTPASLTANTLYWVVIRSSDADGANYYSVALWDGVPQYGKGIWGVGTSSVWLSGTWQAKDSPITLVYGRKE